MAGVKSPEERGVVGAWAYQERDSRDWSVETAVEQLAREGVSISTSYLRSIESNSKTASARVLRGLKKLYGSSPADTKKEAAEPQLSDLIAALQAQTDALNALAARLDMSVEAQRGQTEGMVQAMTELVGVLRPARVRRESPRGSSSGTQP